VQRFPVGTQPVLNPETGEALIDELGRRSYLTSMAYGPSIGKNIGLAYLPHEFCQKGRKLQTTYFDEIYELEVVGIGYESIYDPQNLRSRS